MRVQSWAPSPCLADGGFKSHGVAVCTPRQQQHQLQQQLQQEVEEKADVSVIGNEGKHVCTCRDKSHGRQPCVPYLGFVWWGNATWHNSRVHPAAGKLAVAENGRGVIAGCLQHTENDRFRPDGNKSSVMAARTPWQAAATAAAGEVTERSGLGVPSASSFFVRQPIAGVGYRSGHHRWAFRRNG